MAKEAKAAEPKRQHDVPRFHLKDFVGKKEKLFIVNRPAERAFREANHYTEA